MLKTQNNVIIAYVDKCFYYAEWRVFMRQPVNGSMFKNSNNNKKKNPLVLIAILAVLAAAMILVQYVVMDINSEMRKQMQQAATEQSAE